MLGERLDLLPRSAMLTSRNRIVRKLGHLGSGMQTLATVRRPKWLLERGVVPATTVGVRSTRPGGEAEVRLCERLIAAFERARKLEPSATALGGAWTWILDHRQQKLVESLERGDATALAETMSSMFAEDYVLGLAPGLPWRMPESAVSARARGIKCLEGVAALAEVFGVAPVENPERGGTAPAFETGLPSVIAAIEAELGFELDFPDVGAPCGLEEGGRLITLDTPDQIYGAIRAKDAIAFSAVRRDGLEQCRVVEVGGGYGALCYWFHRQPDCPATSYTIVDLPVVNVIQGYFLASTLGHERVSVFGESPADVHVVPNSALCELAVPFEVLVNKDGLTEMPREARMAYLRWAKDHCRTLFYSYNQEAAMETEGEPQEAVHRALAQIGGFERLSRNRSWLRDGYVEELYVPKS